MNDLFAIRRIAREATQRAAKLEQKPLLAEREDMDNIRGHLRCMPFLGDHVAPGFELVETHFVDSSGFGADWESALTQEAFFEKIQPGHFYGVVEAGQFQVHIGEFKKV